MLLSALQIFRHAFQCLSVVSLLFNQQSQQGQGLLPAQVALLGRDHGRYAFLGMSTSVPQDTARRLIVVCICPGRFGSSNAAV